jgi:hypothetical protein
MSEVDEAFANVINELAEEASKHQYEVSVRGSIIWPMVQALCGQTLLVTARVAQLEKKLEALEQRTRT